MGQPTLHLCKKSLRKCRIWQIFLNLRKTKYDFWKLYIQFVDLTDSYWFHELVIKRFDQLEQEKILKISLVIDEIAQLCEQFSEQLWLKFRFDFFGTWLEDINLPF